MPCLPIPFHTTYVRVCFHLVSLFPSFPPLPSSHPPSPNPQCALFSIQALPALPGGAVCLSGCRSKPGPQQHCSKLTCIAMPFTSMLVHTYGVISCDDTQTEGTIMHTCTCVRTCTLAARLRVQKAPNLRTHNFMCIVTKQCTYIDRSNIRILYILASYTVHVRKYIRTYIRMHAAYCVT